MNWLRLLGSLLLVAGLSFALSACSTSSDGDAEGTQCAAEIMELKPVDFHNTWQPDVTVRVYEYDLACPDMVFQDPSDVAWSLGSPGHDLDAHLLLPQGNYSICIDWLDDGGSTYSYKIYGDLPDDIHLTLNENSNKTVPPEISVTPGEPTDGTGRCPAPTNMDGVTDDDDDNGNGDSSAIAVDLIGNHDETAVYNPTEQQISDADVTLSGTLNSLSINWKLQNVITVIVAGNNTTVYAIAGASDGTGGQYTLTPPVSYGNYSIPNTENIVGGQSPDLIAGEFYTVSVATSDGKSSYIGFTLSN